MFTILGATGNTGGAAARALLEQGEKVRVVGRDAARLRPLAALGAQPFVADVEDEAALREAFTGATAAWVLVPPNMAVDDFSAYQDRVTAAVTAAVRAAGLECVALLSSIGANHSAGTGPIAGLHRFEQALRAVPGLDTLSVRAGYFLQNFLWSVGLVKSQGVLGSAVAPDVPFGMVEPGDVGRYAAARLLKGDFRGFTAVNVFNAAETMTRAARVLGAAIGKPDLPYVQFPYEAAERAGVEAGLKPKLAALYTEMSQALNERRCDPEPGTTTVTAPTSLEAFAPVFAAAYRS